MDEFFDPEIFNIEEDEYNYIISTKDGEQCLSFYIDEDTLHIDRLDKCGSNGNTLLKLIEKYAVSRGISFIRLDDKSKLDVKCKSGENISIDLAILKLLTKGKSWYNSLGYFSSKLENVDEIAESSCLNAMDLSKSIQIKLILENHSIEFLEREKDSCIGCLSFLIEDIQYKIDNNEEIIADKIADVESEFVAIINDAEILFPDNDLELSVRSYLNDILPEKFVEEGNCEEYKFIRDFINFISPLLNYETLLTKTLVRGGRKKRKFTKSFKSSLYYF